MTAGAREPWPAPPAAGSSAGERYAWYAAVARWAPSKNNTQPWRFVIEDDTSLEVWSDPMRTLPHTDPHHREMVISCGAAVQLACVAARALGREPTVIPLPGSDTSLLARVCEDGPHDTT